MVWFWTLVFVVGNTAFLCVFFFLIYFFIGVDLPQCKSIVDLQHYGHFCCTAQWLSYTHIYILFYILFHCGLSQNTEYSSPCYTVVGQCSFWWALSNLCKRPGTGPAMWKRQRKCLSTYFLLFFPPALAGPQPESLFRGLLRQLQGCPLLPPPGHFQSVSNPAGPFRVEEFLAVMWPYSDSERSCVREIWH